MKNNKTFKSTDVDLNNLQFFNSDEFNKFMSNLLNQDTLNQKNRESVLDKFDKTFDFYKAIKDINTNENISNKQVQTNSLLSSRGFSENLDLRLR